MAEAKPVVAITGAGGAIGNALALGFAQSGAAVAVCELNETSGRQTVAQIVALGGHATFHHLDVTLRQSVAVCVEDIVREHGHIDVWINNAGINLEPNERRPFQDFLEDRYQSIMAVDLRGLVDCTRRVARQMVAQRGGSIINISSVGGIVPLRLQSAFLMAKAAVLGLTRSAAIDYAPHNIRVNAIAPGSILFEKTRALFYADPAKSQAMTSHIPQGKPGTPEDVIQSALYLASERSAYVTGTTLVVDGGWVSGFTRSFD